MSGQDAAAAVLLGLAALVQLISLLGFFSMPNLFDRIHFLAPASVLAPALVAVAVLARESFNTRGVKALLVAFALAAIGPVLTHATARAARVHSHGDWRKTPRRRS